jgi:hypothetical protein
MEGKRTHTRYHLGIDALSSLCALEPGAGVGHFFGAMPAATAARSISKPSLQCLQEDMAMKLTYALSTISMNRCHGSNSVCSPPLANRTIF